MKDLLSDVVHISGDFFFFCREVHNSITLILDHDECFISLASSWSSIVGLLDVESIFQTSFSAEVVSTSGRDVFGIELLIIFK